MLQPECVVRADMRTMPADIGLVPPPLKEKISGGCRARASGGGANPSASCPSVIIGVECVG